MRAVVPWGSRRGGRAVGCGSVPLGAAPLRYAVGWPRVRQHRSAAGLFRVWRVRSPVGRRSARRWCTRGRRPRGWRAAARARRAGARRRRSRPRRRRGTRSAACCTGQWPWQSWTPVRPPAPTGRAVAAKPSSLSASTRAVGAGGGVVARGGEPDGIPLLERRRRGCARSPRRPGGRRCSRGSAAPRRRASRSRPRARCVRRRRRRRRAPGGPGPAGAGGHVLLDGALLDERVEVAAHGGGRQLEVATQLGSGDGPVRRRPCAGPGSACATRAARRARRPSSRAAAAHG